MPRIDPQSSKFKRIEVSMRQTLLAYRKAIEEIDKALTANRTEQERALLQTIRQEWVESHKQAMKVLEHLFTGVEHPKA